MSTSKAPAAAAAGSQPAFVQAAPPAVTAPRTPLRSTLTGLLAAFGLSPIAGNSPLAPADSPAMWGLLGWTRGQNAKITANQASTAVANHIQNSLIAAPAAAADPASVTDALPAFTATTLVSGLTAPTDFAVLPDGRVLIAEKDGTIVVANKNGQLQSTPLITLPVDSSGTRGLLGMTVDPRYRFNGYVYVTYTQADDAAGNTYERLSRIKVGHPRAAVLTANPASEKVLIQGDQPGTQDHFGGGLAFGPDGRLYWSTGDNSCCSVIGGDSQDLSNIYGKVLRLNRWGGVPLGNPFRNTPGVNPYIYAYGFRNPFRLTFTPTGQLLVADVGQSTWEEIDLVTKGGNYGWPNAEGPCDGIGVSDCSSPSSYINPIFAYPHDGGTASITGVMVYTGPGSSKTTPTLLYTDFTGAYVASTTCVADYSSCGDPTGAPTWQWTSTPFTDAAPGQTPDLAMGPKGTIYQLVFSSGELVQLTPTVA